ncbi:hypothetical protein VQ056_05110 [Paenibacillus sp. JTLBN-2024]
MIPTYNNMETVYPIVTSMIFPFRKDVVQAKRRGFRNSESRVL